MTLSLLVANGLGCALNPYYLYFCFFSRIIRCRCVSRSCFGRLLILSMNLRGIFVTHIHCIYILFFGAHLQRVYCCSAYVCFRLRTTEDSFISILHTRPGYSQVFYFLAVVVFSSFFSMALYTCSNYYFMHIFFLIPILLLFFIENVGSRTWSRPHPGSHKMKISFSTAIRSASLADHLLSCTSSCSTFGLPFPAKFQIIPTYQRSEECQKP